MSRPALVSRLALLAGLALLAACSELPAFDAGVCGNFVVEPGEDCDTADASCQQCRLQCTAAVGGPPACSVAGYECGVDGFCHAPSGRFGEVSAAVPLTTTAFSVTDIDRDGYGDVVALSATSLTVRYGERSGALGVQASTLTPVVQGPPTFARLDADDSLDIVLPTDDGIVAYSSPFGVLAPHPFAIDLEAPTTCAATKDSMDLISRKHVFSLSERYLGVLFYSGASGKDLGLAVLDVNARDACPVQIHEALCPGAPGAKTSQLDVYTTILQTAQPTAAGVIAINTSMGLCAALLEPAPFMVSEPFEISPLTSSPYPAMTGRPVLAELETGDGCPSVVFSVQPTVGTWVHREYKGSIENDACSLSSVAKNLTEGSVAPQSRAIGQLRLDPADPAFGRDALVFASGVYGVQQGPNQYLYELYASDRALSRVLSGDFDLDGRLDLVAINVGSEDVDVLYRLPPTPFGPPPGLLRYRIDTVGPVRELAVGDFDGNHVDDVVFTEQGEASQRLLLGYGTRDRVLAPVQVGTHPSITGLFPMQADTSADPFYVVDDLAVIDTLAPPDPDDLFVDVPRLVTRLHGSPQRTMLSYFDPRPPRNERFGRDTMIAGVIAGTFSPRTDGLTDLVSIQIPKPVSGTTSSGITVPLPFDPDVPTLYRMTNTGTGGFQYEAGRASDGMGQCDLAPSANESKMCMNGARYLRWPVGDHDVVIAVDSRGEERSGMFDPDSGASAWSAAPDGVSSNHRVRALHRVDTDGDGAFELLASFTLTGQAGEASVMLCQVSSAGVPQPGCADLATLIGRTQCTDAAPARIAPAGRLDPTPTAATELLALCEGSVVRVTHDGTGYQAVPTGAERALGAARGDLRSLQVGDVTGDGLEDLLLSSIDATNPTPLLIVIPQCAASDLACRGEPSVETGVRQ